MKTSGPKIITVIQARRGSSRLPGKVLLPILGKTLLERMLERVNAASKVGTVVIATTTEPTDDEIAALCDRIGAACFRGHPTDLLDRHYQAGLEYGADVVVKIPSDCPLIDPSVIDRVLDAHLAAPEAFDYVSNLHPATYPDGNDVEVIPMPVLKTAWTEAQRPMEREHMTPFIWENPDRFRLRNVEWETGLDYSMSHRWTIDYPQDYEFIRAVFQELYRPGSIFSLQEILSLLKAKPEIAAINQDLAGVNWYRNHLHELRTIDADRTRSV